MYAGINDLKTRLGASYGRIYGTASSEAEADLICAAAEIDGFLANRYLVPVTAPASMPLLKNWHITLAEELAFSRAGGSSIPEKISDRAKAVRQQLEKTASGLFRLPGALETGSGKGSAAFVDIDKPVFRRDQLEGF